MFDYYKIVVNGQSIGPFAFDQLLLDFQLGKWTPQTLVWKPGLADWTPAMFMPEFAAVIAQQQPPLPAQTHIGQQLPQVVPVQQLSPQTQLQPLVQPQQVLPVPQPLQQMPVQTRPAPTTVPAADPVPSQHLTLAKQQETTNVATNNVVIQLSAPVTPEKEGQGHAVRYSPISLNKIPGTLRSTLTPREVVVAVGKSSWVYILGCLIFGGHFFGFLMNIAIYVLIAKFAGEGVDTNSIVIREIAGFTFMSIIRLIVLRKRIIVATDQRLLCVPKARFFWTTKLDFPLRAVDSFNTDDTFFGNIFGYTKIKFMSNASTHFYPFITKRSCQAVKNAYYDWDSKR
jgi:hypothetical protein